MIVLQHFVRGIAHSSYLLGGERHCAVIDPEREIGVYVELAKSLGMRITHILETHLHADFVSGHIDLGRATGARVYAPASANCAFAHEPVKEGDRIELDDLELEVLETPGHTPEHVAYVARDRLRSEDPVGVFCGDTLFVGDVGRPDLFPGQARELATALYASLHERLLALPDFCEVYPAHGAGSLCGRAMSGKRRSTIGYERRHNAALRIKDREEFIASLTEGMPPAPDHFSRCSAINARGPRPVDRLAPLAALRPEEFRARMAAPRTLVLDVRSVAAFGGQFLPGSIHIDLAGNFSTFAGWLLPPEEKILLVADDEDEAREAVTWLRKVGLDHAVGFLEGGVVAWTVAGLPTDNVPLYSADRLREVALGKEPVVLVDVRSGPEYESGHVEGAIHIPLAELRTRHTELDREASTVIVCGSGWRGNVAASLLKREGFTHVANVAGGMTGYHAAGHGPECRMCFVPHGPQRRGRRDA